MVFKTLHIREKTHRKLRTYIAEHEIKTFSDGIDKLLENENS